MRAHYVVHARDGYVVESFRGSVTYAGVAHFLARQAADERIAAHFHTVSDYTQASIRLSNDEVLRLALLLSSRTGKRALVVCDASVLAYANLLAARLEHANLAVECFRHRRAALHWIKPSDASAANRRAVSASAALHLRNSLKSAVST